jgi:hypothetical protein
MIKEKSKEGMSFELTVDGKLWVRGKDLQKFLGTVRHGVFVPDTLRWKGHWAIARFPLVKTATFGIKIVRLVAQESSKGTFTGFVHPKILLERANENDKYMNRMLKWTRVKIFPSDLQETVEKAEKKYRR